MDFGRGIMPGKSRDGLVEFLAAMDPDSFIAIPHAQRHSELDRVRVDKYPTCDAFKAHFFGTYITDLR